MIASAMTLEMAPTSVSWGKGWTELSAFFKLEPGRGR